MLINRLRDRNESVALVLTTYQVTDNDFIKASFQNNGRYDTMCSVFICQSFDFLLFPANY